MKDTKRKYFGYWTIDHKAMEEHIRREAEAGWAFDGFFLSCFARFRRCEPGEYRFFVDWRDAFNEDADYLALCAEAGWESVAEWQYLRVFRALSDCDSAPIHTDGGLELEHFFKKVFRRMCIGALVIAMAYALLAWTLSMSGSGWLVTLMGAGFVGAALIVLMPLLALGGLIYLAFMVERMLVWRRCARQERELSAPRSWTVKLHRTMSLLAVLISAAATLSIWLSWVDMGVLRNLGYIIGTFIGLFIVIAGRKKITETTRKLYVKILLGFAGAVVLATVLHGFFPSMLSFAAPKAEEGPILYTDYEELNHSNSPLLRYDYWAEGRRDANNVEILVSRYACCSGTVADMAVEKLCSDAGAAIPEGAGDGVWELEGRNRSFFLIREGNQVMKLYISGSTEEDESEILAAAVDFLSLE